MVETDDEWITSRTGIRHRYVCQEGESCRTLAIAAARAAIERGRLYLADKNANTKDGILEGTAKNTKDNNRENSIDNIIEKIGAVYVATSTGDYMFPSVACLVAKELGLPASVQAFDLVAACSGFLYGMDLARNYLLAHPDQFVLVVGAEQLSRIVDYTDRSTCILFGDGAGAAIFGAADQAYVHHSGCDGDIEVLSCGGVGVADQHLHMKGNAVFRFAVSTLKNVIDQILNEKEISLADVDYVICHQANARIIDHVKKRFPGFEEKFYMNLENYGNTSAASIPMVINELFEKKLLKTGMKLICVGFGAGLTWGGTYCEI